MIIKIELFWSFRNWRLEFIWDLEFRIWDLRLIFDADYQRNIERAKISDA
jgi:hypothetical protein